MAAAPFWMDFATSAFSAGLSKTICSPVENVKLVQQRYHVSLPEACSFINSHKGPLGFFSSNTVNVLRYFPTQAFNFAFKGYIKNKINFQPQNVFAKILVNIVTGGLAGSLSLILVYPLDVIRSHQATSEKPMSMIQAVEHVGFGGLYSGLTISFLGVFVYRGVYFGLYDTLSTTVPQNSVLGRFAMGYTVTVVAGLVTYPIDTIRREMMWGSCGTIQAVSNIYDQSGLLGFWSGALCNTLRGLLGAFVLVGVDFFVDFLSPKPPKTR